MPKLGLDVDLSPNWGQDFWTPFLSGGGVSGGAINLNNSQLLIQSHMILANPKPAPPAPGLARCSQEPLRPRISPAGPYLQLHFTSTKSVSTVCVGGILYVERH